MKWFSKWFAMSNLRARSRKPAGIRNRRGHPLHVEPLEARLVLNHNAVAFFVNGYGGQAVPPAVIDHLTALFQTAVNNHILVNYDVYDTNWNSPDPTSCVYASSHQPSGGSISGNPGSIYDNLLQAATTLVLGTPIFNDVVAHVDPNAPNPALPNTFVNALSNFLDTHYDDGDFVVLVGHSLGGNSILRVANQTHRKIDLLVSLDPCGMEPHRGYRDGKMVTLYVSPCQFAA